jgi:hypothetical protein
MAFERMKGVEGLVYVPEDDGRLKKQPCKDCYHCQWCSDTRCDLCLNTKSRTKTPFEVDISCLDCVKGR